MGVMTLGALIATGGGKSELAATISSVVQERLRFNLSPETEGRVKTARLVTGSASTDGVVWLRTDSTQRGKFGGNAGWGWEEVGGESEEGGGEASCRPSDQRFDQYPSRFLVCG